MFRAAVLVLLLQFTTLVPMSKGARPGNKFALVVDQSGSMREDRTQKAIAASLLISQQPTDDMGVCLFGFGGTSLRWNGGWKELPDAKVVKSLGTWLKNNKPPNQMTKVIPALLHALKEKKKALTVVIISDGEFDNEPIERILAALEKGQKERVKNKLPRAIVMTMCVGSASKLTTKKMRALGKAGKGGCYLWGGKSSKKQ